MPTITDITPRDMEALALPGRHDLEGTFHGGPESGQYFNCFLIKTDTHEISALASDRSTGIAEAIPAQSPDGVRGYLIQFYATDESPLRREYFGLGSTTRRSEVIGTCERIALALNEGNLEMAINILRDQSNEFLER